MSKAPTPDRPDVSPAGPRKMAEIERLSARAEPVAWICFSKAPHWFAPVLHIGKLPPDPLTADEAIKRGFVPVAPIAAPSQSAVGKP